MELNRESPIFDEVITISVQNGEEFRATSLAFRIIPGARPTGSAGQNERLIHIEIADENDPYFLYLLEIGDMDYGVVKRSQGILVEFIDFPRHLIKLLNYSEQAHEDDPSRDESSYRGASSVFAVKLDIHTGVLSFVETNEFKMITHISLAMRPGNDSAIKAYLAGRLQLTLSLLRSSEEKSEALRLHLDEESEICQQLKNELHELKTHKDVDMKGVLSAHAQELAKFQVQAAETLELTRQRHEEKMNALRNEYQDSMSEWKLRHQNLENQLTELSKEKSQMEYQLRDLSRKLALLQEDSERGQVDLNQALADRRTAEDVKSQQEREIARLSSRVDLLTQQLHDKDEMMAQTVALQKSGEVSRAAMQETIAMHVANNDSLQEKLKAGAQELVRGNEVLSRLQAECREWRDKVKLKSEVIRRQEAAVQELRNRLATAEGHLTGLQDSVRTLTQDRDSLKALCEEKSKKLDDANQTNDNNQQVISYLNEELSKWQLGFRLDGDLNILTGTPGQQRSSGQSKFKGVVTPQQPFSEAPEGNNLLNASDLIATMGEMNPTAQKTMRAESVGRSHIDEFFMPVSSTKNQNISNVSPSTATPGEKYRQQFSGSLYETRPLYRESAVGPTGVGRQSYSRPASSSSRDVYQRGLEKLGLTEAFRGIDDGLGAEEDALAGYDFQSHSSSSKSGGSGGIGGGGGDSCTEVDLEQMGYYALGKPRQQVHSSPPKKKSTGLRNQSSLTPTKYDWQSPEFGMVS